MNAKEKALFSAEVLDRKKASEIRILHVEPHTALTSYFVLAHGTSRPQVKALAEEVEDKLAEAGCLVKNKEIDPDATWVALDYEDVILHIFQKDTREFFDLEHIWAQAEEIPLPKTEEETTKEGE